MPDYEWKPIEDVQADWREIADDGLSSLASVWNEQKAKLTGSDALERFNSELQREWALETGIIEGLYKIDRGTTELLIERGIDASIIPHGAFDKPLEDVLPIIKDQESVIAGLFDFVSQKRDLSVSYIKELHQALTVNQSTCEAYDQFGSLHKVPMLHGKWKTQPNNPSRSDGTTHYYCPPEQVESEMDKLIEMHKLHVLSNLAPEVEAAWLHHRFTQIHPFQDGNGRVARAIATLVFLREGWFPLVIVSERHREGYLDALEKADAGDLSDLVGMFAELQRSALIQALSISRDVTTSKESPALDAMISSIAARVEGRLEEKMAEMEHSFELSNQLEGKAHDSLLDVKDQLAERLTEIDDEYLVTVAQCREDSRHWFWNQVVTVAQGFKYFANLKKYHRWQCLRIRRPGERQLDFVISFHSLGREFVGVVAVSAFIQYRSQDEGSNSILDGPHVICRKPFQFSYNESEESVSRRFEKWLNDTLVSGLDHFRRQI